MKHLVAVCLAFLLTAAFTAQCTDRQGMYYKALSSGEEESIDKVLAELGSENPHPK